MEIKLKLNGRQISCQVDADTVLLDFLREKGCFSVKRGCDTANCGLSPFGCPERPGCPGAGPHSRSSGTHFHPGNNVGIGKDDTLFANVDGILRFETKHGGRKCVSVYPEEIAG